MEHLSATPLLDGRGSPSQTEVMEKKPASPKVQMRQKRLAQALKANLARRKAQDRARHREQEKQPERHEDSNSD
jgi:hypothetical protein